MIKRLFNMFSGKSEPAKKGHSSNVKKGSLKDVVNFVDYVVRALVDSPELVKVELADSERGQVINITCKKEDIGKIIGKNGKTIMAIRALVTGAASRLNQQVNVEVIDQVAD